MNSSIVTQYIMVALLFVLLIFSVSPVKAQPDTTKIAAQETEDTIGGLFVSNGILEQPKDGGTTINYLSTGDIIGATDKGAEKSVVVGSTAGSASVSPSGAATYQIPIFTLPGTGGMEPSISLVYSSQSGNGLLGMGWNFTGLSAITRAPQTLYHDGARTGISITNSDRFAIDGNRMYVTSGTNGANNSVYATEIADFAKYQSFGVTGQGPSWFKSITKAGVIIEYGNSTTSKYLLEGNNTIFTWYISKIINPNGQYMTFHYTQGAGEITLDRVEYTGAVGITPYNTIRFTYEARPDVVVSYIAGAKATKTKRLKYITVEGEGNSIRKYEMTYTANGFSYLVSIIEHGLLNASTLNPTTFQWNELGDDEFSDKTPWVNQLCVTTGWNEKDHPRLTGDVDGDGLEDAVGFGYDEVSLYKSTGTNFELAANISSGHFTYTGGWVDSDKQPRVLADVNGDGKLDIVGFEGIDGNGVWVSFFNGTGFTTPELKLNVFRYRFGDKCIAFMSDANGDGRADIVGIGEDGVWVALSLGTSFGTPTKWLSNFAYNAGGWELDKHPRTMADVNGDGKADLIGFGAGGVSVAISNGTSAFTITSQWNLADFGYNAGGWRTESHVRTMADVNGDGLPDIVGFGGDRVLVSLNAGAGFLTPQPWNYDFCINYNNWTVKSHPRFLTDVNGDGMADIVGYGPTGVKVSLSNGSTFGNSKEWSSEFGYNSWSNEDLKRTVADINGDGLSDLVGFGSTATFCATSKRKPVNQLSEVTTGVGYRTKFNYDFLTNKTIYQKQSNADYPLIDFQGSMQVVTSLEASNGIGQNTTTSTYAYKGAKVHLQGKGFLGIMEFTVSNNDLNITNKSISAVNVTVFQPFLTNKLVTVNSNTVSSTILTNQIHVVSGKRHFPYVSKVVEIDELSNNTSTKDFVYNSWGNLTQLSVNLNNEAFETTSNTYIYKAGNGTTPNRLESSIVTKIIGSSPSFTQSNSFIYDSKGNIETSSNGLQEVHHVLNSMGLPDQTTVTASGEVRSESFLYDSKYRFVEKTENVLGHKVVNAYDGPMAVKTSTTGIDLKTTTFGYDAFLRPDFSRNPFEIVTASTLNWANGNGPENAVYYKEVTITGKPTSRTYFDLLGRTLRAEIDHISGVKRQDFVYNSKGQLEKSSLPYFAEGTPKWKVFTYDSYGRIETETINSQTTSYSYPQKTVTTTTPDSKTYIKTYNGFGKLAVSQDEGGIINYAYHSSGQPKTISYTGGATTTIDYDAYGRQNILIDPSAGTTTYDYNGFGQLTTQTDAKGNTYTLGYDEIGRIDSKVGPNQNISYEYVPSGNGIGQLEREKDAVSQDFTSYVYNQNGLPETITERIDGQNFVTGLEYNQYGDNTKITYPSGYSFGYNYSSGFLTSIVDNQSQSTVWNFGVETALDQPKDYTLCNGSINVIYSYDSNDQLSRIQTGNIDDFQFNFNPSSGNLDSRSDNRLTLTESFGYDNLNRLDSISSPVQNLSIIYESNGNITSKGLGNFTYDGNKLTGINQFTPQLPSSYKSSQAITYTTFNKVETITQGSNLYSIRYGTDRQRNKSELRQSGVLKKTVYYLGSYEKEITPTGTREIHYISSPYGVVAAAIKQNGASSLYYLSADHLGSIMTVFRPDGTVAERNSYDAWGRRRNSTNWSYTLGTISDRIITRGFTFHEHLDEFNLINMNGRMYDPILGRFLSPDPYVQAPDFSQSFNRYSYCVNNPLSFVDPSGEKFTFWHHASAIFFGAASWSGIYKHATGQATFGQAAGEYVVNVAAFLTGAYAGNAASGATTLQGFWGGAIAGAAGGAAGGFVGGAGNAWVYGADFTDGLNKGLVAGGIGLVSGGLIGGMVGGIDATVNGRDFWDGFDYQKALNNAVAKEGLNNPNSRWRVASKKNARLVNETFNKKITRVQGNKIYLPDGTYSEYGVNFGTMSKGNITLVSKQVIRDNAYFSLTDVLLHEGTHQLQVLSGMSAISDGGLAMEWGAYMTNILHPANNATIPKVFNVLVNDWQINPSTLWETILNIYPYGPIP